MTKYSIFIDYSGSTTGQSYYWNKVRDIVNEHKDVISHYYYWNGDCIRGDNDIERWRRKADGGTYPSYMIPFLLECSHVIIVTDGEISQSEVNECRYLLSKHTFKFIKVYVVNESEHSINHLFLSLSLRILHMKYIKTMKYLSKSARELTSTLINTLIILNYSYLNMKTYITKYTVNTLTHVICIWQIN